MGFFDRTNNSMIVNAFKELSKRRDCEVFLFAKFYEIAWHYFFRVLVIISNCILVSGLLSSCCKLLLSVIIIIGSRPSDHYFRSVCWFVCLFVCRYRSTNQANSASRPFGVDKLVSCNWMSATSIRGDAMWWMLTNKRQAWCSLQVKLCDSCLSALYASTNTLYKYFVNIH